MNAAETIRLCRVISGLKPAQKFDDETPVFWHPVLEDITLTDALDAVKVLAREERFIDTSDIVQRVAIARQARAKIDADTLVPNIDPDEVEAYRAERQAIIAAAASGTLDADQYAAGGTTLTGFTPWRTREARALPEAPERLKAILGATPMRSAPGADR